MSKAMSNKKAFLSYPKSNNLGDYIQSIATKEIIGEDSIGLDRENLHIYNGSNVYLIMNGWFMQNSRNWPPSDKITPFFISFHINPIAKDNLLSKKGLEYFQKHEPIGCRDMYTQNLLQKKGINSYFSGCLTLTLRNKKKDFKKEGVLIIGALDRLKPKIDIKNLFNELIKYPYKFFKYNRSKKRLDDFILNKGFSKVTYKSQIIDLYKNVDKQRNLLANEQLNLIAKSKLVITSRLHVALPAIAYGTKVIFLKDGLEHINHQSRLKGISDYFYCCKSEDLNTLSLVDVKPKKNHRKIKKKLIESIDQFFKNK
tara:strand:- start:12674 stop:13612 length:939 start_codon:yes stop_codon:yes gene_type:complete